MSERARLQVALSSLVVVLVVGIPFSAAGWRREQWPLSGRKEAVYSKDRAIA